MLFIDILYSVCGPTVTHCFFWLHFLAWNTILQYQFSIKILQIVISFSFFAVYALDPSEGDQSDEGYVSTYGEVVTNPPSSVPSRSRNIRLRPETSPESENTSLRSRSEKNSSAGQKPVEEHIFWDRKNVNGPRTEHISEEEARYLYLRNDRARNQSNQQNQQNQKYQQNQLYEENPQYEANQQYDQNQQNRQNRQNQRGSSSRSQQ